MSKRSAHYDMCRLTAHKQAAGRPAASALPLSFRAHQSRAGPTAPSIHPPTHIATPQTNPHRRCTPHLQPAQLRDDAQRGGDAAASACAPAAAGAGRAVCGGGGAQQGVALEGQPLQLRRQRRQVGRERLQSAAAAGGRRPAGTSVVLAPAVRVLRQVERRQPRQRLQRGLLPATATSPATAAAAAAGDDALRRRRRRPRRPRQLARRAVQAPRSQAAWQRRHLRGQ